MTELEHLKLIWRHRVAETRAEWSEAALRSREARDHTNGHFLLSSLERAEILALHAYMRAVLCYYHLVVHNRVPNGDS